MTTTFSLHKTSALLLSVLTCSILFAGCASNDTDTTLDEDEMMDDMNDDMNDENTVNVPAKPVATCGEKNAECGTSDDCCGAMGLECQPVQTSSGLSKRCLPVEVMVCRSDCTNGVWGQKRSCKLMVASKDMIKCQDFIGDSCVTSVNDHRNDRECTDT
ncbi:hypothetical protein COU75_02405 [Candidatus Peregrinibacteria bacterium CG10_big_fil_rev_8_21_14_0_10_42_8]|nr:MAG: hypothetical protein COU75_02405 [Candidatus Peregrinibacteria bacterium CG10_big_fil_rev_8_21_14_0_10_42_8]